MSLKISPINLMTLVASAFRQCQEPSPIQQNDLVGTSIHDDLNFVEFRIGSFKKKRPNITYHLALINLHEAFDSIETWAFTQVIDDARIYSSYTNLLRDI